MAGDFIQDTSLSVSSFGLGTTVQFQFKHGMCVMNVGTNTSWTAKWFQIRQIPLKTSRKLAIIRGNRRTKANRTTTGIHPIGHSSPSNIQQTPRIRSSDYDSERNICLRIHLQTGMSHFLKFSTR